MLFLFGCSHALGVVLYFYWGVCGVCCGTVGLSSSNAFACCDPLGVVPRLWDKNNNACTRARLWTISRTSRFGCRTLPRTLSFSPVDLRVPWRLSTVSLFICAAGRKETVVVAFPPVSSSKSSLLSHPKFLPQLVGRLRPTLMSALTRTSEEALFVGGELRPKCWL